MNRCIATQSLTTAGSPACLMISINFRRRSVSCRNWQGTEMKELGEKNKHVFEILAQNPLDGHPVGLTVGGVLRASSQICI